MPSAPSATGFFGASVTTPAPWIDRTTQITLTDAQYRRLQEESRRSGVGLAELVRRAIEHRYGTSGSDELLRALDGSFGSWKDRDFDGAGYVEALRPGMARRLAQQ